MTTEKRLDVVKKFIESFNIEDEDLIQNFYLIALEVGADASYKTLYNKISSLYHKELKANTVTVEVSINVLVPDAIEDVMKLDLKDIIYSLLSSELTEAEAKVLSLRFGLYNGNAYTLKETAALCGITIDKVRGLQWRAIHKLGSSSKSVRLRNYFDDYTDDSDINLF